MPKRGSFRASGALTAVFRIYLAALFLSAFIPYLNPARLSGLISKNASLFTLLSYPAIGSNFVRALDRGWVEQPALTLTYLGTLVCGLGIALAAAAFCVSLGNVRMRRLSAKLAGGAALTGLAGTAVLLLAHGAFAGAPNPERLDPMLPPGLPACFGLFGLALLLAAAVWLTLPKPAGDERYELKPKYRLFLMILPFLALVALFSYLPLWGWRYALYDYRAGFELTRETFVGFRWFRYLFSNAATRADIVRVLKNTFAMSGLGLAFSWLPMAFAIFLSEIRFNTSKRVVQTVTTIPHFISWVLVYSVAFALFSTEGFVNWALVGTGIIQEGTNYLTSGENMWLKMWLWGTWKGLGWSAIIYIAGISSIDPQLYEAATVDGAGRFAKMWHVTVPGLTSAYFVMLLLSISNILSNGMDQYLVFSNANNKSAIEVLDLFIYNLGLASSSTNIPLATLIGVLKSLISVTLLFGANYASKWVREESIV
ncbi:MAG: ABC transporter permease subunit [Oscillospiraceae bacterium]|nr:ABC transporter permease subunit [Oscillospiraceae bacterium]